MTKATPIFYILFLISTSCAQKVVHYVNASSSFKTYTSYVVVNYKVNEKDLSPEGAELFNKINSLIDQQMTRRGYLTDNAEPDLIVRYELISNQVTEVGVNNRAFYSPFPRPYYTSRTFLESALLVEITDNSTKKLVWQASVDLNKYSRKNKTEEILGKAIEQLFNTYLYRAGAATPDESLKVER